MTADEGFGVALWATNLSPPLDGLDAWAARIDGRMAEAACAGARLLVMPEYCAEQWLSFKPFGLSPDSEIAWMASLAPVALERLRRLPARHGIGLLAGTMPWQDGGRYYNRAWLLLPDGRAIPQDKLSLTPSERDPATWTLTPGDTLRCVDWAGVRLATLVCLDVEMPALSVLLGKAAVDLVLVPSMTSGLAGYSRVFGCAKARAVELMAVVAATGVVGAARGSTQNSTNVSGCAVYVPCEPGLGGTGIVANEGPFDGRDGRDMLMVVEDLPLGKIRKMRQGSAEVWPGAWSAGHVRLVREDGV